MKSSNVYLCVFLFAVAVAAGCASVRAESPLADDRVAVFIMKEDPSVGPFLRVFESPGFYVLEVDEWKGLATVYYKVGDVLKIGRADLKVKGDKLTLKYIRNQKVYRRAMLPTSYGGTRETITPIECAPENGGWRYGPSLERNVVKRGDEEAVRIIISRARHEYELIKRKCAEFPDECGAPGCAEWQAVPATGTVITPAVAAPPVPTPIPAAPKLPFAKALLEAKISFNDIVTTYKSDIDTMLPPTLNDNVIVISTNYHTSSLPYPDIFDPQIEKKGLTIGVIGKNYRLDKTSSLSIEIQPLPVEYQTPAPNKCGTWTSDSTKSFFDFRGQPAVYNAPSTGGSSLVACGRAVSVSLKSTSVSSKDALLSFLNALPFDDIERLAGAPK